MVPGSSMLSMFQPEKPSIAVKKEAIMRINEMPERMGKMISCLFSFKTLKLFMAIVQPLDNFVKKFIVYILGFNKG